MTASADAAFARLWRRFDAGTGIDDREAARAEMAAQRAPSGLAYLIRGFVSALLRGEKASDLPDEGLDVPALPRGVPEDAPAELRERARFALTPWDHGDTPARRMVETLAQHVTSCAPIPRAAITRARRVLRAVPSSHPMDRVDLQTFVDLATHLIQAERSRA